jgi:hypothetical protein
MGKAKAERLDSQRNQLTSAELLPYHAASCRLELPLIGNH